MHSAKLSTKELKMLEKPAETENLFFFSVIWSYSIFVWQTEQYADVWSAAAINPEGFKLNRCNVSVKSQLGYLTPAVSSVCVCVCVWDLWRVSAWCNTHTIAKVVMDQWRIPGSDMSTVKKCRQTVNWVTTRRFRLWCQDPAACFILHQLWWRSWFRRDIVWLLLTFTLSLSPEMRRRHISTTRERQTPPSHPGWPGCAQVSIIKIERYW